MYMYIWPSSDKVRVGIRIGAGGAQKLRFKDKAWWNACLRVIKWCCEISRGMRLNMFFVRLCENSHFDD